MATFLKGTELNLELENIFYDAKELVVIISPYVKIHAKIKDALKTHLNNPHFHLVIVFGKNETDLSKSIAKEDLEFFKEFTSVEIRYESRLHAKYYANESTSLLSSMNLYDYSFNNNIEFGILTSQDDSNSAKLDKEAYTYFETVIENSEILFDKEAEFDSKMMGLKKQYKGSKVVIDTLDNRIKSTKSKGGNNKGFCIRTGIKIPFNMKMPMSEKAYSSWSKYKDENYREKYCHFTGEESDGETSFSRPVLKKNWKKAVM